MNDPELQAALEARDIGAVVDRLSDLLAPPSDHDGWVVDMLADGIPEDVDDESRARIREELRDRLPGIAERTTHA